jgi:ribosome-binding factor A
LKTNNNRLLRVGENIRAILSKHIISNELYIKHLKNVIVTITEVRPSKDLKHAKVFVSSVGGNEEKVAEELNNNSNLFSKLVSKEIKTKYTPRLRFFPDLAHKKASLINKIINEK